FGELVPQHAVLHHPVQGDHVLAVLGFQGAGFGRDARVPSRGGLVFGGAGFGFGADRLEPHGLGAQADVAELLADVRGGPAGFCPVAVPHVPERLIGQGPDVHRVGLGDGSERVVPGGAHFGGVAAGLGADRFSIVAGAVEVAVGGDLAVPVLPV